MDGSLATYKRKRDFAATPEPAGRVRRGRGTLQFVVQKHAARNLHYDFRLELDGVLKSWAVPKGVSESVGVRRLAVEVEDHPLDYARFEGDIPAGQYGAGHVDLWDSGTWTPIGDPRAGLREGHLKFDLAGKRLQGRWALIRMAPRDGEKKANWLLIRERIPAARSASARSRATASPRKAPVPARLSPQLATLAAAPPTGDGWIYEIKFDGYRLLARRSGDEAHVYTRTGLDWSARFPSIVAGLRALKAKDAWIDGEAIALNDDGRADFARLQQSLDEKHSTNVRFAVFDLLYLDGVDLRARPLSERRAMLKKLLGPRPVPPLVFSEELHGDGKGLLREACELGLEGLIAKRADAPYVERRTRDWLKLKCRPRDEFVIGGYTEPRGTRAGLGALLLGTFDGSTLRYRGRVGTGLDQDELVRLHAKLKRIETTKSPFSDPPRRHGNGAAVHWVRPTRVAEIEYATMTREGLVRQGSFVGLRSDKPARSVAKPAVAVAADGKVEVAGVAITHADRIVAGAGDITKLEVARYHEAVAKWLLPQVASRPLALVKCPGGDLAHCFFQKHAGEPARAGKQAPDTPPWMHLPTLRDVVGAVQNGAFEFHTWGASIPRLDRPDRIVLDLDPDPALTWQNVREGCDLVRALLDRLDLVWFVKTTGGKGLHFVLPLARRYDWDAVKTFAHALAADLARTRPSLFIATMSKTQRKGRIFVDYLRNTEGATAVAAYSLRARAGLPVSLPIAWSALDDDVRGDHFNLRNVPALLARRRDPWASYESARQQITASARRALGVERPASSA
jgi:bifunctional non-homologous end joining protein LigD